LQGIGEADEEDNAEAAEGDDEGSGRIPASVSNTLDVGRQGYMAMMLLPTFPPKVRYPIFVASVDDPRIICLDDNNDNSRYRAMYLVSVMPPIQQQSTHNLIASRAETN
jgi:hypothetical protein